MADMNINIKVNNLNDLDKVNNKIKSIDNSTKMSATSLAKWGVALTAVAISIGAIHKKASEYQKELNKIRGTTDKLTQSNARVEASLKKTAYAISQSTKMQEAFNLANEVYISFLEDVEMLLSGKSRRQIKIEAELHKGALQHLKDEKRLAKERARALEESISLSERFAQSWADSEMEEQIDQEAHALAEANIALKKYNDELRERARIARQIKQDAKDAEGFGLSSNIADHDAKLAQEEKALKDNTKAVEENTLHVMQWSKQTQGLLTGYFENGKYQASVGERSAIYKASGQGLQGGMDLANKSQMASLFANLANSKKKHSGSFNGDTSEADFEREKEKKLHVLDIEMAILEKRLAVEKVTLSYATKRLEADKAKLKDAQDLVSALNSGLKDFLSQLEGISKALKEDYVYRAKGSLFGHTSSGNTFANAKAEAKEAWKNYQGDKNNQELVNIYREKMDRVISSLDEFKDTSKYNSQAEQTFAKHKALRDVKDFQQGQDIASAEVDKSIIELKKLVALTTVQSATDLRAENILKGVKKDTSSTSVGVAGVKGAVTNVKTATDRVASSTNAVKVATDAVKTTTDKLEKKKTERAKTLRNEWTQTGATLESKYTGSDYQIKDQNQDGTFEYGLVKKYSAVVVPTFGMKANAGTDQGYRKGGYTGDGGVNSVAGQVHGQEYVLNANTTKNLGLNNDSGGVFTEMSQLMFEQLKVTKRMYGLEKQMLKLQKDEVA